MGRGDEQLPGLARNDHGFGLIIECLSNPISRRSEEGTAAMEDVAAPVLLAHELMSSLHLYAVAHPERRPDDCSVVGSLGKGA